MGKYILKSFTAIAFSWFIFSNQLQAQSFDNIANAIKNGNASALSANFVGNVEITIKDVEASYSKAQAEMVLKNFFSNHPPKSFSIAHEGTSPEGSKYFIANMNTTNGNYRTYVYAKAQSGMLIIQEIRFEQE